MHRFIIDEDMPRSTKNVLIQDGYVAVDVRDIGLRGADDETIFKYAQQHHLTILTEDRGFGNILRFPLGNHQGIIIIRLPNEMPTQQVNSILIKKLKNITDQNISGKVIIIDQEKIRIRSI